MVVIVVVGDGTIVAIVVEVRHIYILLAPVPLNMTDIIKAF